MRENEVDIRYTLQRIEMYAKSANLHSTTSGGGGGGSSFAMTTFTIGDGHAHTPANGSTTYTNPALVGITPTSLGFALNGVGFLTAGTHYNFNSATGTITLIDGSTFNTNLTYGVIYA